MLYNFGLSDMETNSELSWLLEPQNANEKKKYENILNSRANQLDMSIVMKRYENEISQPIVNLARGELMRSVLIQLQKLKVDTESTIVELDTLIEENDLNLQLLATVPGILLLSPIIFFVHRQIFMRKTAGTETHHKMRKCVGRLQDRLICAYPADASGIFETIEDTGFLLWQCDQIGTYSSSLRRRHMISREDLKQIDRDVRILKSLNLDVAQKRLLINKMYLTHRFLRVN
jgi:nuclear-control-of-ATPase protein 2